MRQYAINIHDNDETVPVWSVTFAHNYAVITATVTALTADEAETEATNLLTDYYGWHLTRFTVQAAEVR